MSTRDRFSGENIQVYAIIFALLLGYFAYASWEELYEAKKLLFLAAFYATAAFLWDFILRQKSAESWAFLFGLSVPVILYGLFVFKLFTFLEVEYNLRIAQKSLVIQDVEFTEMRDESFEYPVGFSLRVTINDQFSNGHYTPGLQRTPSIGTSIHNQTFHNHVRFGAAPTYEKTARGQTIKYSIDYPLRDFSSLQTAEKKNQALCLTEKKREGRNYNDSFHAHWYLNSPISGERINLGTQLARKLSENTAAQAFLLNLNTMDTQFSQENLQSMGWSTVLGQCATKNEKMAKAKYNKKICYCKE